MLFGGFCGRLWQRKEAITRTVVTPASCTTSAGEISPETPHLKTRLSLPAKYLLGHYNAQTPRPGHLNSVVSSMPHASHKISKQLLQKEPQPRRL
jgi:hypothetical protein